MHIKTLLKLKLCIEMYEIITLKVTATINDILHYTC